jgi:hypothetical protein
MAAPAHTYVHYFIPYDGDSEEHPNVYLVRKPAKALTLGDLQQVRASVGLWRAGEETPEGRVLRCGRLLTPFFRCPCAPCRPSRCPASTSSAPSRRTARRMVRDANGNRIVMRVTLLCAFQWG